MKKILFATTALVATASVAAADVTFSGYGRFGVMYTGSTKAVAAEAGDAFVDATSTALDATDDAATIAALEAAGIVVDHSNATTVAITTVAAQYDALLADVVTGGTLAAAVVSAQAAIDKAVATTGESTSTLDGNLKTAADNLAAAQQLLADIAATPAVEAVASDMMITSRLRLNIDASAESDSGVTFGARVRIQQNEGSQGQTNGARFYAKSGGLELGAGNIYGALEFMPGQYPIDLGLTGLSYEYVAYGFNGDAYSSGGTGASGSNGVEVMYSAGDFSAHVSASDTNNRVAGVAAYTMSGWTVALGAQDSDAAGDTEWTATVGGTIGDVSVGLAYADNGTNGDKTVLSGKFNVGAATNVEAYYADDSLEADASYGVDFNHDLGGGTSLRGGVASKHSGQTIADFGVRFNF